MFPSATEALKCSRQPTTLHNNVKSELPGYVPWPILLKPLACGFADNLKCANNPCQSEERCRAPQCKKAIQFSRVSLFYAFSS
jgi:hypothetical protein